MYLCGHVHVENHADSVINSYGTRQEASSTVYASSSGVEIAY